MGVGLHSMGVGLHSMGVGLHRMGVGLHSMGVGLHSMGVGLHSMGVRLLKVKWTQGVINTREASVLPHIRSQLAVAWRLTVYVHEYTVNLAPLHSSSLIYSPPDRH